MATYQGGVVDITNVQRRHPNHRGPKVLAQGSVALSGRVGMIGGTSSGPSGAPRTHQLAEGFSRPPRAGGMVRQGNEGACREEPGVGPPKGQETAQALDKWS